MTETNEPYVRYTRALDEPDAADNVALRFAVENADRVPMMPRGDLYRVTIELIQEPEMEKIWYCHWDVVTGYSAPSETPDDRKYVSIGWEDEEVIDVIALLCGFTAPTAAEFAAAVLAATGVTIPVTEPEEEPRWMTWGRNRIGDQWADTDDCDVAMAFGEAGVMNWCRLWGNSLDRDAKRERLQAVAREVGKP